jgi:hypothetical protein
VKFGHNYPLLQPKINLKIGHFLDFFLLPTPPFDYIPENPTSQRNLKPMKTEILKICGHMFQNTYKRGRKKIHVLSNFLHFSVKTHDNLRLFGLVGLKKE